MQSKRLRKVSGALVLVLTAVTAWRAAGVPWSVIAFFLGIAALTLTGAWLLTGGFNE